VIVSNGGLPEVVDNAGMMFCLSNPDGLRNALKECLGSDELRYELREKGLARAREFSWQATSELVWKHLNEI
jgi:glycosyltransferase involved in cell wall biosynthesis